MTAAMANSSYDVLGDPSEYEAWLASQKPPDPEPAQEPDQGNFGQHVADIAGLPSDIAAVVMQMDQQHTPAILSAYNELQSLRCALLCMHIHMDDLSWINRNAAQARPC